MAARHGTSGGVAVISCVGALTVKTWTEAEYAAYLVDFPASRGMTAEELLKLGEDTDWEDGEVWEWAQFYCHEQDKLAHAKSLPNSTDQGVQ